MRARSSSRPRSATSSPTRWRPSRRRRLARLPVAGDTEVPFLRVGVDAYRGASIVDVAPLVLPISESARRLRLPRARRMTRYPRPHDRAALNHAGRAPPSGSECARPAPQLGAARESSAPWAPRLRRQPRRLHAPARGAGLHYIPAAIGSFLVAVANNYALNRHWTFRVERGHVGAQGWRFLVVSTISLLANLTVLHLLVTAGIGRSSRRRSRSSS